MNAKDNPGQQQASGQADPGRFLGSHLLLRVAADNACCCCSLLPRGCCLEAAAAGMVFAGVCACIAAGCPAVNAGCFALASMVLGCNSQTIHHYMPAAHVCADIVYSGWLSGCANLHMLCHCMQAYIRYVTACKPPYTVPVQAKLHTSCHCMQAYIHYVTMCKPAALACSVTVN